MCALVWFKPYLVVSTLWHTDLLPVLAFELVLLERPLALLDVGFLLVLVQVEDEERELPLEHVLLPLGQLLLSQPQKLLVRLLLQSGALQLLFTTQQLLCARTHTLLHNCSTPLLSDPHKA